MARYTTAQDHYTRARWAAYLSRLVGPKPAVTVGALDRALLQADWEDGIEADNARRGAIRGYLLGKRTVSGDMAFRIGAALRALGAPANELTALYGAGRYADLIALLARLVEPDPGGVRRRRAAGSSTAARLLAKDVALDRQRNRSVALDLQAALPLAVDVALDQQRFILAGEVTPGLFDDDDPSFQEALGVCTALDAAVVSVVRVTWQSMKAHPMDGLRSALASRARLAYACAHLIDDPAMDDPALARDYAWRAFDDWALELEGQYDSAASDRITQREGFRSKYRQFRETTQTFEDRERERRLEAIRAVEEAAGDQQPCGDAERPRTSQQRAPAQPRSSTVTASNGVRRSPASSTKAGE